MDSPQTRTRCARRQRKPCSRLRDSIIRAFAHRSRTRTFAISFLESRALGRDFGPCRRIRVIDAQFAIVSVSPDALDIRQRLPHVDAYGRDRIALVHRK